MNQSNEIKQFAKAFIAAQKEMTNAAKDTRNPHFRNKYADLTSVREACVPYLTKYNIGVLQATRHTPEGKKYIETILMHESGEYMSCETEIVCKNPTDPQAQGSGITYARRYGLQSLVCIAAEDDDGNQASQIKPTTPPTKVFKVTTGNVALQNELKQAGFDRAVDVDLSIVYYSKELSVTGYEAAKAKLTSGLHKGFFKEELQMYVVGNPQDAKALNNE
jgi:hypothetical protein